MPTPPKGLPPKSPAAIAAAAQQSSSYLRRPTNGAWGQRLPYLAGRSRSRSSSDVGSSVQEDSSAPPSRTGGESSIAPTKAGGGVGGGVGGGGLVGGGGGEEEGGHGSYGGRYGFALRSYDLINKPKPYWELAADIIQKGASMPKKKVVPLLRELCIRIGDNNVCDGAFFGALLAIVHSAKDGDWDRKAVRLVHFFVRGMVTAQGDTDGRMLGSHWEGRGITSRQILHAVESFREESEHRSAVRRIPAFQTLAILCQLAYEAGIGGQPPPIDVLREATIAPLQSFQAQERPEGGGKGRSHRQRLEVFQESLQISGNIFSAVRRCPALARDVAILPTVLLGCCSENPLAARHSFAVLADQATASPAVVSQALLNKAMLLPTAVGMLQAPEGIPSSSEQPNLSDSLACVYYLRALKALAFSEVLDDTMRLDMYRTMVSSVSDARHRVALEAMQCLLDHPRAWELLVDAQRESRDADIFRRVVDRIKLCVEEATAPSSNTALTAAGAAQTLPSAAGSAERSSKKTAGKGVVGGVSGVVAMAKEGGDGAQCNWALAHAACRVCRVVGRTFQVAISYQTIQSQNREQSNSSRGNAANSSTLGNAGAPPSASGMGPRPPSFRAEPGWAGQWGASANAEGGGGEHAAKGGGAGGPRGAELTLDQSASGSAFNLLGLPPTPPPRSAVTGASAWSGVGAWGEKGTEDVMAGQVVEEQNTAAIHDLCRVLQQHKLLESPHLHVRSLALEAMFLLVPDPSPLDPQLLGLWGWLQQRVQQCPSTLPDSVLSELVDTLLTRVHCSAASREDVIPIALSLTESFMYQVPSEELGRCVLRAWCQCVGYGGRSREAVLQSVYRLLDRNIALPPEPHGDAAFAEQSGGGGVGAASGASGGASFDEARNGEKTRHVRGAPSEDWTRLTMPSHLSTDPPQSGSPGVSAAFSSPIRQSSNRGRVYTGGGSAGGDFSWDDGTSILGGEEASRWGKLAGPDVLDPNVAQKLSFLKARGAATRLKRSAYWFLGEYCCQLTGTTTQPSPPSGEAVFDTTTGSVLLHNSPQSRHAPGNDLLAAWSSNAAASGAANHNKSLSGVFDGVEAGAGAGVRAVPHPVVAEMNGATISILMRLKHAAMFEDFQTRHTCAAALCKVALRLPEPVRFDAYFFLKGLADAADIFPLVKPARRTVTDSAACGCETGADSLESYRREQEELADRIEDAGAFGIGEAITPVLDYLDCVYAAALRRDATETASGEESHTEERSSLKKSSLVGGWEMGEGAVGGSGILDDETLHLYRRLLNDGLGAAA